MMCYKCKVVLQKTELKDLYKCPMCKNVEEVVEEEEAKCENQQ
jgi:phage FluMu protein Com